MCVYVPYLSVRPCMCSCFVFATVCWDVSFYCSADCSSLLVNSFHCFNDIDGDPKVIHSLEQLVIVHRITGRSETGLFLSGPHP
jgi:hypothetical protein